MSWGRSRPIDQPLDSFIAYHRILFVALSIFIVLMLTPCYAMALSEDYTAGDASASSGGDYSSETEDSCDSRQSSFTKKTLDEYQKAKKEERQKDKKNKKNKMKGTENG